MEQTPRAGEQLVHVTRGPWRQAGVLNQSRRPSHVTQWIASTGSSPIDDYWPTRRKENIRWMKITMTERRSIGQVSQGALGCLLLRRG